MTYADDLRLGVHLADIADEITRTRFSAADLRVDAKPDLTPVTDADLAVEQALREALAAQRPADRIVGEEFGGDADLGGRVWVIDPIDGTKNFVRGVPVWATLIALVVDGVPVVGVVSAPLLSRRWWAAAGAGAFGQGPTSVSPQQLSVSGVRELSDASLAFSSLSGWAERGLRGRFLDLTDAVWRVRGYGDFWSYMLLAEGAVDVVTEPEVSLWDLAALDIVVREAGGTFTSLAGAPGPGHGDAVATNGLVHEAVLAALQA